MCLELALDGAASWTTLATNRQTDHIKINFKADTAGVPRYLACLIIIIIIIKNVKIRVTLS